MENSDTTTRIHSTNQASLNSSEAPKYLEYEMEDNAVNGSTVSSSTSNDINKDDDIHENKNTESGTMINISKENGLSSSNGSHSANSLLERIRAKQSQKTSTNIVKLDYAPKNDVDPLTPSLLDIKNNKPYKEDAKKEEDYYPLANSNIMRKSEEEGKETYMSSKDKEASNNEMMESSFLPTPRITSTSTFTSTPIIHTPNSSSKQKNNSFNVQKSIFPPLSSTLKQNSDSMKITETAAYTYSNTLHSLSQRSGSNHIQHNNNDNNYNNNINHSSHVGYHPYSPTPPTIGNQIWNTIQTGIFTFRNKIQHFSNRSRNENYDGYEGGISSHYHNSDNVPLILDDDLEDFHYTAMEGGGSVAGSGAGSGAGGNDKYSMNTYFMTFCRDMYNLTLGRLPQTYPRMVAFGLLLILMVWYLMTFWIQ